MEQRVEMQLGGRRLVLETGRLAKQANAAVMVRYGDKKDYMQLAKFPADSSNVKDARVKKRFCRAVLQTVRFVLCSLKGSAMTFRC
jgi:hypothetical protein